MEELTRDPGCPSRPRGWGRWAARAAGCLALGAGVLTPALDRVEATPGGSGSSGGPASVTYALCTSNLASLQILPPRAPGEAFAIAAQLDRSATKELEQVTEENTGGSLEIVIGDWTFLRGPIRSSLRSGLLVNVAFPSREDAEAWLEKLRSALPESPCGHAS